MKKRVVILLGAGAALGWGANTTGQITQDAGRVVISLLAFLFYSAIFVSVLKYRRKPIKLQLLDRMIQEYSIANRI